MSDSTRPPLPSNFELRVNPLQSNVRAELGGTLPVGPSVNIPAAPVPTSTPTRTRRSPRSRSSQLGRRVARVLSGSLFGFDAPVTRRIARGIRSRSGRSSERVEYQNASAMETLPPSMEAERVQEVQSQSTLNTISETLLRIESTLNNILTGGGMRGGVTGGEDSGGGGGILGLLGSLIGGMSGLSAARAGGLAAVGGLVMRAVSTIARGIFTKIPIIGSLLMVALNIEGAMEEYERNGLGAAAAELIAGIGSDLTFGIVSKERIREIISGATDTVREWWNRATSALENTLTGIGESFSGFFAWVGSTLQDIRDQFNRRRQELEEAAARGREEIDRNRGEMTDRQRAGAVNPGAVAASRMYRDWNVTPEQLEEIQSALETPEEGESGEQRTRRESLNRELTELSSRVTVGSPFVIPANSEIQRYLDERRERNELAQRADEDYAAAEMLNQQSQSQIRRETADTVNDMINAQLSGNEYNTESIDDIQNQLQERIRAERVVASREEAERMQALTAGIETSPEDALQAIDRARIAPPSIAADRTRALSESAPGPTVIPVPVQQPAPASSGGGGGGVSNSGGGGPAAVQAPSAPPPRHPPRPVDFISPTFGLSP